MASLRLSDGRNSFFQWDLNQKLIIENPSVCNKVHFTNSSRDMALVAEVKTDENGVKYVNVPNSLLTMPLTLEVYLYQDNGDCKTTVSKYVFDVVKRNKPENYVYTEDEHKDFDELFYKMEQNVEVSKQALDEYVSTVKEFELDEYTNLKKDEIRGVYSADLSAETTSREEADTNLSNTKADVTYVDGELVKKVNYTDSLTYEEIMASTDLSGKVAGASALNTLGAKVNYVANRASDGFTSLKSEVTIGAYSRCMKFGNYFSMILPISTSSSISAWTSIVQVPIVAAAEVMGLIVPMDSSSVSKNVLPYIPGDSNKVELTNQIGSGSYLIYMVGAVKQ